MSSTINIIDPVYFNNQTRAEFRLDHENVLQKNDVLLRRRSYAHWYC